MQEDEATRNPNSGQNFWLSTQPLEFYPQFQGVSAPSATQIFPDQTTAYITPTVKF